MFRFVRMILFAALTGAGLTGVAAAPAYGDKANTVIIPAQPGCLPGASCINPVDQFRRTQDRMRFERMLQQERIRDMRQYIEKPQVPVFRPSNPLVIDPNLR